VSDVTVAEPDSPPEKPPATDSSSSGQALARRVATTLSIKNASAIYVFVAMFILFSIWVPDTFLTSTTWRSLLNGNATTALVAIGVGIALCAGVFDLSVGATVGIGSMLVSWLLVNKGYSPMTAVIITLAVGALIGVINGFLVVVIGIDSFIATLGVSSILTAAVLAISDGQQIIGLDLGFREFASKQYLGMTTPVYVLIGVAILCWYLLEHTPLGRRVYATGGNREAARLVGVRTGRVIIIALAASAVTASLTGLLIAGTFGTGDPTTGPDYLLPAFSAAFLGSTQFKNGRFNVLGTVVAVYVLSVGVKGLQLAGASFWVPSLFNGAALIIAVGLTRLRGRGPSTRRWLSGRWSRAR
jgi:ribose transport system permease protein